MVILGSTAQNKSSWRAGMAALGLLLAGPASAMDLLQAYQGALEQDATVRAVRAGVQASDERLEQARAARYPYIAFSASYNRNELSKAAVDDQHYPSSNTTLSLRQPIYRKGLSVDLEQAQQIRAEAGAQLDRELQNLSVRVTDAYLQLLYAHEYLTLMQAQKTATTTGLDAARKLLAAGNGTRTDVDEAQARLDIVIAQELETRQQEEYARRQLQTLINQPVDTLSPLDEAKFLAWSPAQRSVQEWLQQAEDNSPEIRQMKARLEAARLEIDKARSGHLPTLDALAQWTNSGSENVYNPGTRYIQRSIGLQLNVPLYSGGSVSSTVRQAVAEQMRTSELLEATRRDLSLRIHTEFRGVSEGPLRIHAMDQAARSAAQLVLSARRSLAGGSRTLMDVLNAEQQKELALRDLARARYLFLMSYVRLQALAGGDGAASVAAVNALLRTP
ncbi:TolC family outer membrane protein [Verminephrobacter eiseniae]|uniref:TolC family outer membrane protein n=1 Tax=Verminephrobacter eiseniae TaxID=364317 RepID=UPI00223909F8|nr:TolC family outer membrane protein [Verminephrobacter eiseniae]MCW5236391.1 channel protein TolC [Verminephrobacter eiseniae]